MYALLDIEICGKCSFVVCLSHTHTLLPNSARHVSKPVPFYAVRRGSNQHGHFIHPSVRFSPFTNNKTVFHLVMLFYHFLFIMDETCSIYDCRIFNNNVSDKGGFYVGFQDFRDLSVCVRCARNSHVACTRQSLSYFIFEAIIQNILFAFLFSNIDIGFPSCSSPLYIYILPIQVSISTKRTLQYIRVVACNQVKRDSVTG